jgi:hypothetical protein
MKQIKIIAHLNGTTSTDTEFLYFDRENNSTQVVIEYPSEYADYHKRADILVGFDKTVDFKTGVGTSLTFLLGAEHLKKGYLTIQPVVALDSTVVKFEHVKYSVRTSLNVIESDTSITPSVAEILQGEIDLLEDNKADKTYVDQQDTILLQEINSLDLRVDELESDVQAIEVDVSETNTRIDELTASDIGYEDGNVSEKLDALNQSVVDLDENKVDKVEGKGLSSNDYTSAEKSKLAGIQENAQVNEVTTTILNNALALKTDKLLATNLVTNGDFSNGTTGWSANNSTISTSANTLINTGNGSGQFPRTNGGSIFANNQTYYVRMRARVTNSNAVEMFIGHGPSAIARITVPIINQWYQVTGVVSNPLNAELRIYHSYADSATANGKVMEVQYVSVLNLTQIFGAGNEPTKEQMDAMLSYFPNSWFNGTQDLLPLLNVVKQLNAKANKTQEAWITPTLLNGYTNAAGITTQYMKDEMGFVHVKGVVTGGSSGLIFNLPVGYRPPHTVGFATSVNGVFGRFIIEANGSITIAGSVFNVIYMDVISFKAV